MKAGTIFLCLGIPGLSLLWHAATCPKHNPRQHVASISKQVQLGKVARFSLPTHFRLEQASRDNITTLKAVSDKVYEDCTLQIGITAEYHPVDEKVAKILIQDKLRLLAASQQFEGIDFLTERKATAVRQTKFAGETIETFVFHRNTYRGRLGPLVSKSVKLHALTTKSGYQIEIIIELRTNTKQAVSTLTFATLEKRVTSFLQELQKSWKWVEPETPEKSG